MWRHFWKSSLNIHWRAGRDQFQRRKLEYQHKCFLEKASVVMQNPITETWNNHFYSANSFLHFLLNLLLLQAARQYFHEFALVFFLSRIHRHQLTFVLPTSVICLPFPAGNAISPAGNKCSQSGTTDKYARTEAARSLYVVQTLSTLTSIIDRATW